jgi:hypothetical protein
LLGGLGDAVDVETGSFELLANSGGGPVGLDEDDVDVLEDASSPARVSSSAPSTSIWRTSGGSTWPTRRSPSTT